MNLIILQWNIKKYCLPLNNLLEPEKMVRQIHIYGKK